MYLFEVNLIKQIAAIFSFQFSTRETKTGFLCKTIPLFGLWVIFLARCSSRRSRELIFPTPARSTKERNVSLNSFFISSRGARSRVECLVETFLAASSTLSLIGRASFWCSSRREVLHETLKARAPGIKYLIRFKLDSQERNYLTPTYDGNPANR